MRLLTHNLMTSHVPGVTNGYPLLLRAAQIETEESEFSPNFVTHMLPKIQWDALIATATAIGVGEDLPKEKPEAPEEDEEFLKKVHHVLLEVKVVSGELECPESHKVFPIKNGVPNMLLREDEV